MAWVVFVYLFACAAGGGLVLAGAGWSSASLPTAFTTVLAKHCPAPGTGGDGRPAEAAAKGPTVPATGASATTTTTTTTLPPTTTLAPTTTTVPARAGATPTPTPTPRPGATATPTPAPSPTPTPAPQAAVDCAPSLVRGLIADAFVVLALVGIVGGSLSGLWSLVMYIGFGTFAKQWTAFYLIRPLAGAIAAPSILFGLDLFQLKPTSIQICLFLAFLASIAVQYYLRKVFDVARTLFLVEERKEGYRTPTKKSDGGGAGAGKTP